VPPPNLPPTPPGFPNPGNLPNIGPLLIVAGEKQKETAGKLKVASTKLRDLSTVLNPTGHVVQNLRLFRNAVGVVRLLLMKIRNQLRLFEEGLASIKVPYISFSTTKIGSVTVITNMSINETRPFLPISAKIAEVAEDLSNMREGLWTLYSGLDALDQRMPHIQNELVQGADALESASNSMTIVGEKMIEAGKKLP
jgi:hypothetical protein